MNDDFDQNESGRDEHGRFKTDSKVARMMGRKGGKQRAENQKKNKDLDRDTDDNRE